MNNKIKKAADCIKKGDIIIFPTDTIYAIGGNAYNKNVYNNIYKIKKREICKSLIVLINSIKQLDQLVDNLSCKEKDIIQNYWPGELTIVFKANKNIPKHLKNKDNTIAIRMPNNKVTLDLINECGCPLLAPSANISGEKTPQEIESLKTIFNDNVAYYLDIKKKENNKSSTIIKVVDEKVIILREGFIKKEKLINDVITIC